MFGDMFDDGKAKPSPTSGLASPRIHAVKALCQARNMICRNAIALVTDCEGNRIFQAAGERDPNGFLVPAILYRIID